MKLTTLCYIEKDESYLMLHRVKKKNDENQDKWIGVGGKFKPGETLTDYRFRGIVTFLSDIWEGEYMHLFTADSYGGELTPQRMKDCDEGELVWVPKAEIPNLNIWEGDKIFLRLLAESQDFFSLKLRYEGERLAETKVERYT